MLRNEETTSFYGSAYAAGGTRFTLAINTKKWSPKPYRERDSRYFFRNIEPSASGRTVKRKSRSRFSPITCSSTADWIEC